LNANKLITQLGFTFWATLYTADRNVSKMIHNITESVRTMCRIGLYEN